VGRGLPKFSSNNTIKNIRNAHKIHTKKLK